MGLTRERSLLDTVMSWLAPESSCTVMIRSEPQAESATLVCVISPVIDVSGREMLLHSYSGLPSAGIMRVKTRANVAEIIVSTLL